MGSISSARVFVPRRPFQTSLMFVGKAGTFQGKALFRLGCNWLKVSNTLAIYNSVIITNGKSFIGQAHVSDIDLDVG
jgi:hypothetical protein